MIKSGWQWLITDRYWSIVVHTIYQDVRQQLTTMMVLVCVSFKPLTRNPRTQHFCFAPQRLSNLSEPSLDHHLTNIWPNMDHHFIRMFTVHHSWRQQFAIQNMAMNFNSCWVRSILQVLKLRIYGCKGYFCGKVRLVMGRELSWWLRVLEGGGQWLMIRECLTLVKCLE